MAARSSPFVRYLSGGATEVPPDAPARFIEAANHVLDGGSVDEMVRWESGGSGRVVSIDTTWHRLLAEALKDLERDTEGNDERATCFLETLRAAVSESTPDAVWEVAKPMIYANVDLISGWEHSYQRQSSAERSVFREGDEYFFEDEDGELCGIIGQRTATEERWDYIADQSQRKYGLIHALLRTIATATACQDWLADSSGYPESMHAVLPENGGTYFLGWRWQSRWPFRLRLIDWQPVNRLTDARWLAADWLAYFAKMEDLSDLPEPQPVSDDFRQRFDQRFAKWGRQLEIAVKTDAIFGDEEEVWFTFGDRTLRWVNRTSEREALLIVPMSADEEYDQPAEMGLRFLSQLSFQQGVGIAALGTIGCARRVLPMYHHPRRMVGATYPHARFKEDKGISEDKRVAYGFFREGAAADTPYYAFLNFYKILELGLDGDADIIRWINQEIDAACRGEKRVGELRAEVQNIGKYILTDGRHAVAHAQIRKKGARTAADPDDPTHLGRIGQDLPLVRRLAVHALKSDLFDAE